MEEDQGEYPDSLLYHFPSQLRLDALPELVDVSVSRTLLTALLTALKANGKDRVNVYVRAFFALKASLNLTSGTVMVYCTMWWKMLNVKVVCEYPFSCQYYSSIGAHRLKAKQKSRKIWRVEAVS